MERDRARRLKVIDSQLYIAKSTKRCTNCKVVKEASDFSRNPYDADGLESECKQCRALFRRTYKEKRKENRSKVGS